MTMATTEIHQPRARATLRVLESYERAVTLEDVLESELQRVRQALDHFPELAAETVNLGLLHEKASAIAKAYSHNRLVCFRPNERTSNVTIYHELGHLAIRVRYERDEDVPRTSEEFCSLFAMARMPADHIDYAEIPYIGEPSAPRDEWPAIAQRALDYREERRNYIQKAKEWYDV